MNAQDVAIIIGAVGSLITVITAAYKSLKTKLAEVHTLVNSQLEMVNNQLDVVRKDLDRMTEQRNELRNEKKERGF